MLQKENTPVALDIFILVPFLFLKIYFGLLDASGYLQILASSKGIINEYTRDIRRGRVQRKYLWT